MMDAMVYKNKIIMKTNFRETPTSREKPPIRRLRGYKVHVFMLIIFTDFSDKHKHEVTYAHAVN